MTDEQRFYEGDVITVRGLEFTVEQVDRIPDGRVIQYRLSTDLDNLAANLRVKEDAYVLAEYRTVEDEDITVIE